MTWSRLFMTACSRSKRRRAPFKDNHGSTISNVSQPKTVSSPRQEVDVANHKGSSKSSERSRAAIYARVSSKQQAQANTIASQIEALKARVQSDGLRLETELCFIDEGYSGGTLRRPALERLRDQAAVGAFDRIYVHSPDRLSRSYPHQVLLVEELQRLGVEIAFLNHDIGRSPEENLLLQVQGMMAEYERAKIHERSRRGKRYAAKAGNVSVLSGAPYGYRYIGKYEGGGQARYEIVEAQAEVVRQMFAWVALDRCSIGQVCRQLQEREILSPRGKNYWDRTTVWGILKNSAYVGQARFSKTQVGPQRPRLRGQRNKPEQSRKEASVYDTPIEDQIVIPVPAIIEEAVFTAVAEQLAENRMRRRECKRGSRYLLQGLVVCAKCGYAYYGTAQKIRANCERVERATRTRDVSRSERLFLMAFLIPSWSLSCSFRQP
jgi:site-specific DNA recombinase